MEKPHKKLDVWNKSMKFVEEIYKATKEFPKEEKYGITSQIRRSAISIPSNIAEGAARHSQAEFKQFVHIAMGSCSELDTQLELSCRLGYLSKDIWNDLDHKLHDIDLMLIGLRNSLNNERKISK